VTTKATKIISMSKGVNGNNAGNPTKNPGTEVGVWLDAMVNVVKDQAHEHGKL
jgi:hypothetical protein